MMSRLRPLISAALLAAAFPAMALDLQPTNAASRIVAVKGNANVRAKASLASEILFSSKKGQALKVIREVEDPKAAADEPSRWSEVVVPAGTHLWVYGALIDSTNKVVRANSVNLRAGPGRNYSDVGNISRGTPIKIIHANEGWIEIEAPEGAAHGFVASTLLGNEVVAPATAPPPAPAVASTIVPATPRPVAPARTVPLPANNTRPAPTIGRTVPADPIVDTQPLAPARTAVTPRRVVQPPVVQDEAQPIETAPVAVEPATAPVTPTPVATQPNPIPVVTPLVSQPEIIHTDKVREVIREGVVDFARSPQAPSDYQLNNFRKGEAMIGFIYTDDKAIRFSDWRWKRVLITGEEYIDPAWPRRPLIKVTAIHDAY